MNWIMEKGLLILKYYKGEYLNGEKNGKGKEYNDYGILVFEGENKNGKKWTGKVYDEYNNIYELNDGKGFIKYYSSTGHFEVEYLNGEKNGKGKEYDKNGELEFEGEYINGEKNGKGKEYCYWNVIFEGEYLDDEKRKGKEYNNNDNLEFEGEYLFGIKYNGIGYDRFGNIISKLNNGSVILEVEYLNGERNGQGREYDDKGNIIFEGKYLNGERNGFGKEYDCSGKLLFEGEYLNGKKLLKWKI